MGTASRNSLRGLFAVAAAFLFAGGAHAQSASFVGNVTAVCVNSGAGFDASQRALGPTSMSSFVSAGTVTFYPGGTGVLVNRSESIGHAATGPGATPATQSESTCPFTYVMTGTIRATFGTCTGSILTGPNAGHATEISGLRAEWMLMDGGMALVGVGTRATVETNRNLTTGFTNQRICHRTGTRYRTANPGGAS